MKKIIFALAVFVITGIGFVALSNVSNRRQQQLNTHQADWLVRNQQLDQIQAEHATLATQVRDLKRKLQRSLGATPIDPGLAEFLLSNDIKLATPETQERILANFGSGENSSDNYVLVSKAALTNSVLKPLKNFPNTEKLTDAVRGVLAITPEERQSVESIFAEAFDALGDWAKANVQREAESGDMLARYTIPADSAFAQMQTNKLFSNISAVIGEERGELMRKFFQHNRIYSDGGIGDGTNILSIHRISASPGFGYRAGRKWDRSETINTYPEPIKPNRFPAAFRFIFPGGWEELAQREGWELPKDFQEKK
ncbi:MAG: hypothetical protein ABI042_16390 [Verrucomicrobiota bacterium]